MICLPSTQVVRHRLMGVFTAGLETPQELLTALPEVQFQSTLTAEDQKRWKDAGAPIKVSLRFIALLCCVFALPALSRLHVLFAVVLCAALCSDAPCGARVVR